MWNDQRVTHLYPAAKASLGIDGCFGGFCHLLHYLRNQLMFLHHVQRLALEETRHAAEPAPRGSTGRFVTAAKSWANRLQLHSFGMVHVEVIESLWRYSWIPQTWPQVDLRKKTHQHQLLGNMMFKQTCLKSSKAPFCKDSLRRIFLTVIRRTSCMLRPAWAQNLPELKTSHFETNLEQVI